MRFHCGSGANRLSIIYICPLIGLPKQTDLVCSTINLECFYQLSGPILCQPWDVFLVGALRRHFFDIGPGYRGPTYGLSQTVDDELETSFVHNLLEDV